MGISGIRSTGSVGFQPASLPRGTGVPPVERARFRGGTSDAGVLRALEAAGRIPDVRDPAVVRQAAAQLTSELFFSPMLAEMRRFPFGRELTSGGPMEGVFGEQFDRRVADAVAASETGALGQVIRHIEGRLSGAARSQTCPAPGTGQACWPAQMQVQQISVKGDV